MFGPQKENSQKHRFSFKCYKCGVKSHKKQDCTQKCTSTSSISTRIVNVTEHKEEIAFITYLST